MTPHAVLIQLLRLALACMIGILALPPVRAYAALVIRAVDAGTPSADDEYILFENTGNAAVDLSRYSVQVKNVGVVTMQKKNFSASTSIAPSETFIVAHKNGRYALQARMTYSSLSLSENGGEVALTSTTTLLASFDHPSIAAQFKFQPREDTPTPESKKEPAAVSAVPENNTVINHSKLWDIRISELMPRPTSGDEFIEIANHSRDAVDVAGLVLRDGARVQYALGSRGENTVLGPSEHRAWWRSRTRIALNDTDGELIQLLDPSGTIIDQVQMEEDAIPDSAFARVAGGWMWTTLPTPSHPNQYSAVAQPPVARAIIPSGPHRVGDEIFFSAADTTDPNGDIIAVRWNFGDGLFANTTNTTHRYQDAGNFTVIFSATDSAAASSTVTRVVHVLPIFIASSTSATTVATPKILSTTSTPSIITHYAPKKISTAVQTATTRNQFIYQRGIITVPPNVLGRRRFVVDDRVVETTTNRPELARLTRGTVVAYSGRTVENDTAHIQRIAKQNIFRITGAATPPPLTEISGDVLELRGTSFLMSASSTDVVVMARARSADDRRIKQGDRVTVRGVLVQRTPDERSLVPLSSRDILVHTPPPIRAQPLGVQHLMLLGGSGIILFLLHFLFTHYAHRLYHPSNAEGRFTTTTRRAWDSCRHAALRLADFARRTAAWCARLLGAHLHDHR